MLEALKFIFKCVAQLISVLFEIDLGFTSLGVLMCIITFFFPMFLLLLNMLKVKMKGD